MPITTEMYSVLIIGIEAVFLVRHCYYLSIIPDYTYPTV